MAKFSKRTYTQMFDALLSEELYFDSLYVSEDNIKNATKRILGRSIKTDCILSYSDLYVDSDLNVHFKIKDPDEDIISLILLYGE